MPYAAPYSDKLPETVLTCVREPLVTRELGIRLARGRKTSEQTRRYAIGTPCVSRSLCKSHTGAKPLEVNPLKWVVRFRIGAVSTALMSCRHNKLPAAHGVVCPFCARPAETIHHMVFECPEWSALRQEYMAEVLQKAEAIQDTIISDPRTLDEVRCNPDDVCLNLVLGGAYSGKGIPGWMPPRPDLPPDDDDKSSSGPSSWT